jgi:hypothetical protein
LASAQYLKLLRRCVPGKSEIPEVKLDAAGLKHIDSAWLQTDSARKNLRRAYMQLYKYYLENII